MTSQWFMTSPPGSALLPKRERCLRRGHRRCLALLLLVLHPVFALVGTGCTTSKPDAPYMTTPYGQRVTVAVVPLRNESGSRQADGVKFADSLQQQLEQVDGFSTFPVNRVLAAMHQLGIQELATVDQAMALRSALGVDGLVAGSITAYEPYAPPKLGVALDLYFDPQNPAFRTGFNARQTSYAAVDQMSRPLTGSSSWPTQPVSAVSGFYDAERSLTALQINAYAHDQQSGSRDYLAEDVLRLDMNRFSRFVSYAITAKLVAAEDSRIKAAKAQGANTQTAATKPDP